MKDFESEKYSKPSVSTTSETNTDTVSKDGLKLLQRLIQDPKLTQERRRAILSETLVRVNEQIGTPLTLASLNNLSKVVELLLKNDLADVEQTCTITLSDGRRAEGVTALWAAAYANHLDIVKLLVLNRADPNHATRSGSTPLRTSCFHGWNDIVMCLINYGADVNSANSQGSTCLMAAAYNGHRDTVTLLVNKDANLNARDNKGNTALHCAAERGHLLVVKTLLKLDAQVLVNDDGLTPLKLACNSCQDDIMKYLVLRPQTTRYEIIEALELLGATYANHPDKSNADKAYKLLWTAMQHRYNEPDSDVLHKFVRPPVRAYGYRFECQTPEELEAIKTNPHAIHMEGLIVRERLLRTKNLSVPLHIRYRGACLADRGRYQDALELWKYAARIDQRNGYDCLDQLYRIGKLMTEMVRKEQVPAFSHIEELYGYLITDTEKLQNGAEDTARKSSKVDREKELKFEQTQLIVLIYAAVVLQLDLSRKEQRRFTKHIKKFLSLEKEINQGGNTILHLAVSKDTFHGDKEIEKFCKLPSAEIVRLLIDSGADPDASNHRSCTPLHIIASFTKEDPDSKRASTSSAQIDIIEDLLSAGANRNAENDDMLTPAEYAQLEKIKSLISTFANDNLS